MTDGAPWSGVRAFLSARTGMALSGPQVRRLDERLAARSQGLTPHQYLMFLQSPSGVTDLEDLIAAVVVNKTDLFRDEVQLAAFRAQVLTPLVTRNRRPLRVWSAGCATGEEVATLLVLLAEAGADPDSTVLGTDIAGDTLRRARWLAYGREQLRRVPPELRSRYFVRSGAKEALTPALRERASFQCHNLMESPYPVAPGGGGFDVIFCRNVLIYFTEEAFHRTVEALAGSLSPGGVLVLSASEPLLRVPPALRVQRGEQAFFYVRLEEGESEAPAAQHSWNGAASPSRKRGTTVPPGRAPERARPEAHHGLSVPAHLDAGGARGAVATTPESGPEAYAEADLLFACVLDGAASGVSDAVAERDLRRCLTLDPDHAAARYLLGLLLEQCRRTAEAASEYRRAFQALESGRSRPVAFFLNPDRLRVACAHAAERLEFSIQKR
ncbi:CheR family methyltransferase [Myxococcus xanthus]|uniref:CheR family methyltransferase n=1 Tax=Myxococcus xanthus TaxID=34 RepID=UPI00112BB3AB|nr:CheR family methyltransferase [Myxococcus xanthus]QDE84782.1 chemotaxis protein CheR [Myxococcus xanthus]